MQKNRRGRIGQHTSARQQLEQRDVDGREDVAQVSHKQARTEEDEGGASQWHQQTAPLDRRGRAPERGLPNQDFMNSRFTEPEDGTDFTVLPPFHAREKAVEMARNFMCPITTHKCPLHESLITYLGPLFHSAFGHLSEFCGQRPEAKSIFSTGTLLCS